MRTTALHSADNLLLIARAAKMDDVDAALIALMRANQITGGNLAAKHFHAFNWVANGIVEREKHLRVWLRAELDAKAKTEDLTDDDNQGEPT